MIPQHNIHHVDYELQDFMEEMNKIRQKFIETDGSDWSPKDLTEYVGRMDGYMRNKILTHMITVEWIRFTDKTQKPS